jgi:hypothetical protein
VVSAQARIGSDGDATDWVGVGCRYRNTSDGLLGYSLFYSPANNMYHLYRNDPGGPPVDFTGIGQALGALPDKAATHQLRITCSGGTISASVDGNQLTSAQDGTYKSGQATLRAGISSFTSYQTGQVIESYPGIVDARFSNFAIAQP